MDPQEAAAVEAGGCSRTLQLRGCRAALQDLEMPKSLPFVQPQALLDRGDSESSKTMFKLAIKASGRGTNTTHASGVQINPSLEKSHPAESRCRAWLAWTASIPQRSETWTEVARPSAT